MVGRGLTTKTYLQGSYFGDIEVFTNIPRIFSARAEESTVLVVFEKDHINEVLSSHTQSHLNTFKMTFKRYLKYKISTTNLALYSKLNMNDPFWTDQKALRDEIINRDIRKLFEEVFYYHNHSSKRPRKKNSLHDLFVLYEKKRYFDPTPHLIENASQARKNLFTGVTSLLFINNLKKRKRLRHMMSFSRMSKRSSSRKLILVDVQADHKEAEVLKDFNLKFEYLASEVQKKLENLGMQLETMKKKMRVLDSPSPRSPKACKNCRNLRLDLDELITDSTNLSKSEIVSRLKSLVSEESDVEPSVMSDFEAEQLFGPMRRMAPGTLESLGNIKNEGIQSGKLPQTTLFSSENRIVRKNKESPKAVQAHIHPISPASKSKILHKKPNFNRSTSSQGIHLTPVQEENFRPKIPKQFPQPHPSKFQATKTEAVVKQPTSEANPPRLSLVKFGFLQDKVTPILAKRSTSSNFYVLRNNFTKDQKPPPDNLSLLKYTSSQK